MTDLASQMSPLAGLYLRELLEPQFFATSEKDDLDFSEIYSFIDELTEKVKPAPQDPELSGKFLFFLWFSFFFCFPMIVVSLQPFSPS